MECTMWWWTWVLGIIVIWGRNEAWYVLCSRIGKKLAPGHMGFPFVGETLLFLWYGDGVGLYKTKLFGTPSIIAYTPEAIKFVYYNSETFILNGLILQLWATMP
ncbi:hypothetical protein RJ641_009277 [Dillenia turbinata]|uniref:Uncharacterized protein n=1 Tax=Dillenia turbinata TaxID=194707 RepID=A0AAN8V7J9_9MAGN